MMLGVSLSLTMSCLFFFSSVSSFVGWRGKGVPHRLQAHIPPTKQHSGETELCSHSASRMVQDSLLLAWFGSYARPGLITV